MRQKYNTFNPDKIDKNTIKIAKELKKYEEPRPRNVLKTPDLNLVPTDKTLFLEWMCAKYLNLELKYGLPLLKKAYKIQFNIEDTTKICIYCKKPFLHERATAKFCSGRCRQRFKRYGKKTEDVTLSTKNLSKDKSEISKSGVIPLVRGS